MQSILFRGSAEDYPLLVADLSDRGTLGIIEEAAGFRAFFVDEAAVRDVLAAYPSLVLETRVESETRLDTFSRENWDPIFVGERFVVAPSWVELPPTARIRLTVDTTNAFGTGRHESTQLAIRAIERYLVPEATVIDVGCGSGILSAAAKALGAYAVVACDVHQDAVRCAREYLDAGLFHGTIDAVRDSCADLVIANISRLVIEALAPDLDRIAKPTGLVILAGFLRDNPPFGFEPLEAFERDDWLCWVCRAKPVIAASGRYNQQHRIRSDAATWW